MEANRRDNSSPSDSCTVDDSDIRKLFEWVERNGGSHRVCVRADRYGVRGLYSAASFNMDEAERERKKLDAY